MEVVGAAASISQLAVYIHSAATRVDHLYQASQSSAFSTKSQLAEVKALLKILYRIYHNHARSDGEILIPILINITETAQKLYNWLNNTGTISQRLILFLRNVEVEETFGILHQKCNLLLVFYYSERNHCALNRIEDSLRMSRKLSTDADNMGSSESLETQLTELTWSGFDLNGWKDERPGDDFITSRTGQAYSENGIEGLETEKEKHSGSKKLAKPKSSKDHAVASRNGPSKSHDKSFGAETTTPGLQPTLGHDAAKDIATVLLQRRMQAIVQPPSLKQPGDAEERRQAEIDSKGKIKVSGNTSFDTRVDLFNNTYRPKEPVQHEFSDNFMWGQSWKVGNEEPSSQNKESDRDGNRENS